MILWKHLIWSVIRNCKKKLVKIFNISYKAIIRAASQFSYLLIQIVSDNSSSVNIMLLALLAIYSCKLYKVHNIYIYIFIFISV